jgi:malonyl-CoA decarboxylase
VSLLADLLTTVFDRRYAGAERADDRPLAELCRDLLATRSEAQGLELGRRILDRYAALDDPGRHEALRVLDGFDLDADALSDALDAYREAPDAASYRALMAAAEPPRQELARRLNRVPGATARLVAMRADLLRLDEPALGRLDLDLRHLFSSWFNPGFLVLRPITWESPASVLQRIIAYEAVHAIASWDDLRGRLEPPDRRCFAFFHPAMPDEPLIFVEVALTRGVPSSIQALLAEDREPEPRPDTAAFYSISNCQAGLAGVSFGSSLIKQVVEQLRRELPGIGTFVTLSPIPGLADWMAQEGLDPGEPERLRRIAARYLLTAKGRHDRPRDPVARFHLGNGASVHAVHAEADVSERGMARSHGAMVSYLYDPARMGAQHDAFTREGAVAASRAVQSLARSDPMRAAG